MTTLASKLPLAVEIEISSYCNRKCPYCPNSTLKRPEQGDMAEGLFRTLLDQLSELGYQGRISYHFYNEPLASPQLEKFLFWTREALPASRIEIFTNGVLLDRERLSRLIRGGVDKFTVTRHIGADLTEFETSLENLNESDRSKIRYRSHENLIYTTRGGLVSDAPSVRVKPPLRRPCFVPLSVAVITVKGNVVPCFEDYLQQNVMGNIGVRHFGEIWESKKYMEFRTALKESRRSEYPVCRNCDYILAVS